MILFTVLVRAFESLPRRKFMTLSLPAEQASLRVRRAVDRMRKELPQLAEIFDAFQDLVAEQAALKIALPASELTNLTVDPAQFLEGLPLLRKEDFAIDCAYLKKASEWLLPAMAKGFPSISDQLDAVKKALRECENPTEGLMPVMPFGTDQEIEDLSVRLSVDPGILKFVMIQLVKPFAAKRAESVRHVLETLSWKKGYCPICGSWPELGFLEGTEGRRWLKCSFCSHEWVFMRTRCPFCETDDHDKMELYFSEERPYERAELCYKCMRYLVSVDLRNIASDVVRDVAALGLVYLDILAQEKGFSPASLSATLLAAD